MLAKLNTNFVYVRENQFRFTIFDMIIQFDLISYARNTRKKKKDFFLDSF